MTRAREAESIELPPLPDIMNFKSWQTTVVVKVAAASGRGEGAERWTNAVENATSADELAKALLSTRALTTS